MENSGLKIIELAKQDSYLREIESKYSTTHYYDVSVDRGAGSWRILLVRKAFDAILEKNYHGRLFEDHIEEPRAFTVALDGDKEVGWIALGYEKWNNRMRVWEFLVENGYRRRGIGTLMMNHAVKIAREKGARMLILETQTNNADAIDFYLNYGFDLIGLDIAAYSNVDIEKKEVRMELGIKTQSQKTALFARAPNYDEYMLRKGYSCTISMIGWVFRLLEGKGVRLKLCDKEDLDFFVDFWNNLDYYGDYEPIMGQMTKAEAEKRFADTSEKATFIVQKRDGANIGLMVYFGQSSGSMTIGYAIEPSEQGKGQGTEALQLIVDYLFLAEEIHRVQAHTDPENKASQRILEKVGFKKEGVSRRSSFVRGKWRDECLYGILREEWKEPKTLTKAT